jgi:hypothetical protein
MNDTAAGNFCRDMIMKDVARELGQRAEARGSTGEVLSLLTGSESLEELNPRFSGRRQMSVCPPAPATF